MKDFRKFCRPKIKLHSEVGDILIKLKCGTIGAMSPEEYKKVLKFFKLDSFIGESSSSAGKVITTNKITGDTAVFDIETYNLVKDLFEILEIIGEKLIYDPTDGHDYVDLGLPSGTLWATCNVGAANPEDTGLYFSWGSVEGHDRDYVFDESAYGETSGYSLNGDIPVNAQYDAARANFGGGLRMPTKAELEELKNTSYTTWTWTTRNGMNGYLVTSKSNGNSIFLPAAGYVADDGFNDFGSLGYYWSSSYGDEGNAWNLGFNSGSVSMNGRDRNSGRSVRGILDDSNAQIPDNFAQEGDIICHNDVLNKDSIFSYEDWLNLDDNWDAIGLYKIETFDDDDEVTEERKVIMSNGTTFIIKSTDYSSVSSYWEVVDTISVPNLHDYVEIGGIKWATMNIGAESITDTGLFFQWGDTQGYTAAQVGSGEGQKYFGEDDYIYYNDGSYTKYNDGDSLITLESTDDAVTAAWGGNWRMPTVSEWQALREAVNSAWTANYQGSGVSGLVLTDKTDSSKVLFFPAAGYCSDGSVDNVGNDGYYWSSSLYADYGEGSAYNMYFYSDDVSWDGSSNRYHGYSVRGILDE